MKKLYHLTKAAKFQIVGGNKYLFEAYGKNVRYISFKDEKYNIEMDIVFNNKNEDVYQAYLYNVNNQIFRWTNENVMGKHKKECFLNNIDPNVYCDEIMYIDCENFEDFLDKVTTAFELNDKNEILQKNINQNQGINNNWLTVVNQLKKYNIFVSIEENFSISEENIQEIFEWLVCLKLDNINLSYYEEETSQGILSTLVVNDKFKNTNKEKKYVFKY